jgi:hypothetical protein
MKVSELMAKLAKLDPNMDVFCYTEDERFATDDRPFWLLDVHSVDTTKARMGRDTNGIPTATFVDLEAKDARTFVTINVSSDF